MITFDNWEIYILKTYKSISTWEDELLREIRLCRIECLRRQKRPYDKDIVVDYMRELDTRRKKRR